MPYDNFEQHMNGGRIIILGFFRPIAECRKFASKFTERWMLDPLFRGLLSIENCQKKSALIEPMLDKVLAGFQFLIAEIRLFFKNNHFEVILQL